MLIIVRVFCILTWLSVEAASAIAQDAAAMAALPADRAYSIDITASIPGYVAMTGIEKVRALRLYVYQHTPVGTPLVDDQAVRLSLKDAYSVFEKGGTFCSGAAVMLSRVYKAAGFNSWVYEFGSTETSEDPTHATTLVEVNGEVILQDGYLNYEYVDTQGTPIPFLKLIALIAKRAAPRATEGVAKRPWLYSNLADAEEDIGPEKDTMKCEQIAVALRCSAIFTLSRYLETDTGIQEFVASKGWPPQFEYLMLYPMDLFSLYSDGAVQAERLLAEVKRTIRERP